MPLSWIKSVSLHFNSILIASFQILRNWSVNVPVWLDKVYPRGSLPLGRSSSFASLDSDDPALCRGLPPSSCWCSFSSSGEEYQEDLGWPSFLASGPHPDSDQWLWWSCLHCKVEDKKTKNMMGQLQFWVTAIFRCRRVSAKTIAIIVHNSSLVDNSYILLPSALKNVIASIFFL